MPFPLFKTNPAPNLSHNEHFMASPGAKLPDKKVGQTRHSP
jgi:hypothetical protein